MKRILLATEKPFAPIAVDGIREIFSKAGYELVLLEKYPSKDAFIQAVGGVDGLIVRSDQVDADIVAAAKQLKIVVRAGAGYDNIDLKACSARNIVVMNTPGQNSNAVAELVMGIMVYLARNGFNGTSGIELRGKKLGIHGYGHVGRIVGLIGKGFGMKVFAHDPFVDPVMVANDGVQYESDVHDLYRKCQFVSLYLPLTNETRESVTSEFLLLMPEGAMLINTARKEIIHEPSLLEMFEKRADFRYGSDIIPDTAETIARNYPGRYFFTPKKMGAQTFEANMNAGLAAARQIVAFFEKGDITFKVNK